MCVAPRVVSFHNRLSLSDRNHEPCFVSFDTLICGILDLVDILWRLHKISLPVLNSYPNIILYCQLVLLDRIILPSQLNYWVVRCPSILGGNVIPYYSLSAWNEMLGLDFHLFLFFHQSIVHSSICDLPTRTTLLTEFGRPFKNCNLCFYFFDIVFNEFQNFFLRWDILVK